MKSLFLIALVFALASCKDVKKSEYRSAESTVEMKAVVAGASHPGKKLIERECYICHDPKASQESMFAPPMVAVKMYYISEKTTKAQFTENLIKWVNDPETESKMPSALFEFGSMPYIPYPDDAIAQIAEYMYEYDIERPEWYDDALANGDGKGILMNRNIIAKERRQKNADRGMAHANAAKTTLGKNLAKALGEKGTIGAIEFCNTRALTLTDSISVMNNVVIKRVSDKPRNPENMANNEELDYITYFKKLAIAGKEPKPIVKTEYDEVYFYYPITTNAMCLQCHGKPIEQVSTETLSTLKNLYPKDQAVGYGTNEVRGIWVVNFDTEK